MEIFIGFVFFGVAGLFGFGAIGGFESGLAFIGVFIFCFVFLSYWLSFSAKRQIEVLVGAAPNEAAEVVKSAFGIGWRTVAGKGALNFQAKGIGINSYGMSKPVISVDIVDTGSGSSVQIWTSEWSSRMGIVAACDRVITRRWRLTRALRQFDEARANTPFGA
jgi:hypothetical protein